MEFLIGQREGPYTARIASAEDVNRGLGQSPQPGQLASPYGRRGLFSVSCCARASAS